MIAHPVVLTWSGVTARRMARHALAEPSAGLDPAGMAGLLCGAHAQILTAAEFSVGRRIAGATRADVRRALWEDRTLVKTFGPRGTVHLLPAVDLPMWTGALSALPSSAPQHPDGVRFTDGQAAEVIAAISDALAGAGSDVAGLTVDELTEAIGERCGPWAVERTMDAFQDKWPRWRQLTSTAAHRGMLCFGPDRGRKVTYSHPRRWLPGFVPADGDAALRTLVRRYLHAYGPATPWHFARWLAIPPRCAAELFGRLAGDLEQVELDGEPAWVAAGDTGTPAEPHRGLRLLPYFDPYVVAGQPRDRLYPGAAAARALIPSGQAGNYPVLLIDGVVGGVWHQRRSGRKLALTVEPLARLTAAQRRELDEEAALVGTVMEAAVTLTVGPVSVGPHA
ncbi:MAG TPA: winged helix DNA-binding domain-containing protein [Streptosporangiaceae bacterium]|nr:winged helix DNA-binding domain-containing protein [Streptosporangiaceae bacterium]